jgi:hypothetical protein
MNEDFRCGATRVDSGGALPPPERGRVEVGVRLGDN